jgi:hypothetical protein
VFGGMVSKWHGSRLSFLGLRVQAMMMGFGVSEVLAGSASEARARAEITRVIISYRL